MEKKALYLGDNGQHKFWQSKDSTCLIFKNHDEHKWVMIYRNACKGSNDSLIQALKNTKTLFGQECYCDLTKTWQWDKNKDATMKLQRS